MNTAIAPGIGHNTQIPTPEQIIDTLNMDYTDLRSTAERLIADLDLLPPTVTKENLGQLTSCVTQLRSTAAEAESHRVKEKDPYLRGERAVDSFFQGLKERLAKAMHTTSRRVDSYQQAVLAAERAERARQARELQEQAERERLAAERARKPEKVVEKTTQANVTAVAARDAVEAAQAAPAAMTRTRVEEGQLVTMRQVGYVELVDTSKLDLELLRPYIAEDALLAAVKAYARLTKFKKPLAGALIEMRDETVIR